MLPVAVDEHRDAALPDIVEPAARQREAALVTFMVTASGLTLLSIGSAFWGLVAGVLTQAILNARRIA